MKFVDALNSRKALIEDIGYENAYLCLAMSLFLDDPDVDALASIGLVDGADDKKIDFIFHDVDSRRLVFAQGYYSSKTRDEAPSNKASDLNTACAWLVSGDLSHVPARLQPMFASFRAAVDAGEVDQVDLVYAHNLPESINVSRELQTVEGHFRRSLGGDAISVRAHELGATKINGLLEAQSSHIEITDQITFPSRIGIHEAGDKWSAGVATIGADWLHGLYQKYGDKLYSANYRGFLGVDGRRKVNFGIRETAEKESGDFWAFHNGITILTLAMNDGKLSGISIINGAQTSGTLGSLDAQKVPLATVRLLCRVIECSHQPTIESIVRYNNTQNVITTWDRFSNDVDQKRIDDEFKSFGYSYNRKRGFSAGGEQIGIEQVLQPLLAFHGRPIDAVRGKNQLFVQTNLYKNAFENKKARHIVFVYALARAIDAKRTALKIKASSGPLISLEDRQLALLRNLNFKPFFIAVVAACLETIVGRQCDALTVAFKPGAISGTVLTDLVARWLPVVDVMLPLLCSIVNADDFYKKLSAEDNFLSTVKLRMDAMLSATGQSERLSDFTDLVSPA